MLNRIGRTLPLTGSLAPLASADFRRLVSANFIWWSTILMEFVAVGWLALELTDSVWMVSVAGFFRSLPLMLIGPFGGAIADRFGRRRVILVAQTTTIFVYATLALLQFSSRLEFWHLLVCGFALGSSWALDFPSRRALLPDLVGKTHSVDAMMLENFSMGCARILGPWTAGVLLAATGAAGCFAAMSVAGCVGLYILRQLSRKPVVRTVQPVASPLTALGANLRYSIRNQSIFGVLLITVIFNIFLFPYITLLPVFARDVLGQGPVGLGLLGAASGVGSFLGLLLLNRFRRSFTNGWILLVGTLGICAALFVFSNSQIFVLSWFMLVLTGIGQSWFGIMQTAIVLLSSSDNMRQGVMGLVVLAIGADPFGKLWTGGIAQTFTTPFALAANSVLAAVSVVAVAVFLPGLRRQANSAEETEPSHLAEAAQP